jgi:hypothetical protein
MIELISSYFTPAAILAAIASATYIAYLAFINPLGKGLIERTLSKKPSFTAPPVLDSDLGLIVKPANNSARKRRPLGISVRGINVPDAGTLISDGADFFWTFDLAKIDRLSDVFEEGKDYDFHFFFSPERSSEKSTIRYLGKRKQTKVTAEQKTVHAESAAAFLMRLTSNTRLVCDFASETISSAFPAAGPSARWKSVYDGKEVTFQNLENTEVIGSKTSILANPRYAWVLNFENCNSISFKDLVFGHTDSGYCRGGVLRFQSCSNVAITNCDLFGSGTYGIELIDCTNFELDTVTIRNCTYGIAVFKNTSNAQFRECRFIDNEGFDLFEFSEPLDGILFNKCRFERNKAKHSMFYFHEADFGQLDVNVNECLFLENGYTRLTNAEPFLTENNNKHLSVEGPPKKIRVDSM